MANGEATAAVVIAGLDMAIHILKSSHVWMDARVASAHDGVCRVGKFACCNADGG
jgi:hypothetical protein